MPLEFRVIGEGKRFGSLNESARASGPAVFLPGLTPLPWRILALTSLTTYAASPGCSALGIRISRAQGRVQIRGLGRGHLGDSPKGANSGPLHSSL